MMIFGILFGLAILQMSAGMQVVDIASRYAPIGTRGPALVNVEPHFGLPSLFGYNNFLIGPPAGTNFIGLHKGIVQIHGQDHGQYVAVNHGAVHIAPLLGHSYSVKTTNLEPAPGTTVS